MSNRIKRPILYGLKGHNPIPFYSINDFYEHCPNDEQRRVGLTKVGGVEISTVFLTVDHAPHGLTPILFETMVFGLVCSDTDFEYGCWRYTTWEEAEQGHERICAELRAKVISN